MNSMLAFSTPALASAFTANRLRPAVSSPRVAAPAVARVTMAEEKKKPFFRNPFAKKPANEVAPANSFVAPQPGDPGYKPGPNKPVKLPVVNPNQTKRRGISLLRDDFLKNAPERVGVGRQDSASVTMAPQAGEPGYKAAAYQTVKVSTLGISTFSDDKNYVSKVGGIDAVKLAAVEILTTGKSGSAIKREVLNKKDNIVTKVEPTTYDIPDYLKPLPEDTPRRGRTWKNY